jgi:hypothetical protein
MTREVVVNLYREAFALRFESGRLVEAVTVGFREGGDLRLPPQLFTPLVLGYRTRSELETLFPDVGAWGQSRLLVDTLFPKVPSYLYTIY